ncbi:hypothetical protein MBM_00309 [Drepanopeziza brunnea f. sp. 'multigermtubi' MB_m1]|uniref:Uncharacterized protein n=1 Tax=Marssonina brunnea f. sp. multigermtubi (strain MB_m1) TaxID=1072389 RepID=K1X845_MARBU|nr:uncharacterized protein MBM_00309 [Drepanopeziza brunnea f. sp. 'multigermtubi' MB_m1]EKD21196.1 hypothetical protein MBM_00309 [Drepanopeziza brunnea f. sp. 'multigermtubi' MB_m1]
MKNYSKIIQICPRISHIQPRLSTPRSYASSPPRNFQPDVLPRLVIDLDAVNSKHVRKAEDPPVEDQLPWPHLARNFGRAPRSSKIAIQHLRVNSADLWAYALLGLQHSPTHEGTRLKLIAQSKRFDQMDSIETIMAILIHGFSTDATKSLQAAGFRSESHDRISKSLRLARRWCELRSIISMLSTTTEGCQFLATHGLDVSDGIRSCRKAQAAPARYRFKQVTPKMILHLLNNFRISAESKSVGIGAPLCNTGLYYAAKKANLPAIRMYLQTARDHKYAPDSMARSGLNFLFKALYRDRPQLQGGTQEKEVLELITGWKGGIEPRAGEPRKTCFAYLAFGNVPSDFPESIYPVYIMGLGELGLSEALYAEWMSPDPNRMDTMLRGDGHLRFRSHMFAIAFILADDTQRALEVLESVPVHHQDASPPDLHTLEWLPKWMPTSRKNDIPTPNHGLIWIREMILDRYCFHCAPPSEQVRIGLTSFLSNMPHKPQQALEALQKTLPKEIKAHKNRAKLPILGWSTQEERVTIVGYKDKYVTSLIR